MIKILQHLIYRFFDKFHRKKQLRILVVFLLFFIACQNQKQESKEVILIDSTKKLSPNLINTATIFTIPSPTQVVSTLKIINAPFQAELIESYCYTNELYSNQYYKALNLGIVIVDFTYSALNERPELSTKLLSRIEHLIDELDIQDQNSINTYSRLKENIYNKDSVSKYILLAQNSIDRYFQNSNENYVGIWIISSVYLEGLFLLTETYNDLLKNNTISELQQKQLNILLLHQKLFLPNLCDLYDSLSLDKNTTIYKHLQDLNSDFEALNITFKFDDENQKISEVHLDNKHLKTLSKKLSAFRESIISSNFN